MGNGRRYTASKGARTAHPSRPLGTNHEREGCHLGGDAGAAGLGGLTSPSTAGRRGLSALTNAACCAAVKGSASSPGEGATSASVRQHRDVGVPRNSQQQIPLSHHLTTVVISPDCPRRPPLHNLYVSAARFSSNQRLPASLCTMSPWRSPTHFRVHAPKEDERQWDAPCSCSQWRLPPRQCKQTSVRTLFGIGSQLQVPNVNNRHYYVDSNPNVHIFHYDVDGNPNVSLESVPVVERNPGEVLTGTPQIATQHSAHAGSNPGPSPAVASTHTNIRSQAATK